MCFLRKCLCCRNIIRICTSDCPLIVWSNPMLMLQKSNWALIKWFHLFTGSKNELSKKNLLIISGNLFCCCKRGRHVQVNGWHASTSGTNEIISSYYPPWKLKPQIYPPKLNIWVIEEQDRIRRCHHHKYCALTFKITHLSACNPLTPSTQRES